MSKPIKIMKLRAYNKLARMFHIGYDYYEIVVTENDENGEVVRQKTIMADNNRHAKTQFKRYLRCYYESPEQHEERMAWCENSGWYARNRSVC